MAESDGEHALVSSKASEEDVDLQTISDMTKRVIKAYRPIFERLSEL